jgi:hypothetical protein
MTKAMKTIWICINGIRTNPSAQDAWTDEMTSAINLRTPDGVKAEKFEYYCSALFRRLGQAKRADELMRRINLYRNADYRIILVGHSNGCDLIARVLLMGVKVDVVHLFAPAACEEDFARAIASRVVRRIHIYGSRNDKALAFASVTKKVIGLLGLGYGSLGLRGDEFARAFPAHVHDHSNHTYGHSTWFEPGARFEATMDLILANDARDLQP